MRWPFPSVDQLATIASSCNLPSAPESANVVDDPIGSA
jgi:hypothetical protein